MSEKRGKTLFEMLKEWASSDMTPLELQYHNPLKAKIGCIIEFDHEEALAGIGFVIDRIAVYETVIGRKKRYHTDYCVKGVRVDMDRPLRLRLRLSQDEDSTDETGCKMQLFHQIDEMPWDDGFFELVSNNGDYDPEQDDEGEVTFKVNYDESGQELETAWRYWRCEDKTEAYEATVTTLEDANQDGQVDDDELEHFDVRYWDFSRITQNDVEQDLKESLHVELDEETKRFSLYRGVPIEPFQVRML